MSNVLTIQLPNFKRPSFEEVLSFILYNSPDPKYHDEALKYQGTNENISLILKYFVNIINNLYILRGFKFDDIYIDRSGQNQNIYYIYSKIPDKQKQFVVTIYHLSQSFNETYLTKIDKQYTTKNSIIYFISPKWINKQPKNVITIKIDAFLRNIIERNMIQLPELHDEIELYKGIKETKFPRIFIKDPMCQFLNAHKGQFIITKFAQNIGSDIITINIRRVVQNKEKNYDENDEPNDTEESLLEDDVEQNDMVEIQNEDEQ